MDAGDAPSFSAGPDAAEARHRRETFARVETLVYEASPLPDWLTTLALFAAALGGLMGAAALNDVALLRWEGEGVLYVDFSARFGLMMALIFTLAMALGRRGDQVFRAEQDELRAALDSEASVWRLSGRVHRSHRRAFIVYALLGALAGLSPNLFFVFDLVREIGWVRYLVGIGGWFLLITAVNGALFGRAIADSMMDAKVFREVIAKDFTPDPLAPERADVFGRFALGGALSWLLFVGVGLLFFTIGNTGLPTAVVTAVVAAALGAVAFMNAARPVHKAMRRAKREALERARASLKSAAERAQAGDNDAAARLQGLIALEERLARAPEWPVSTPILSRLAIYGLIPIVPWFGSALAQEIVGRKASG